MTIPLSIKTANGLGYYKGGIQNAGFEDYYSSSSLKNWYGSGYRSSYRIEGDYSFRTSGFRNAYYYLTQSLSSSYLNDIIGNNGETVTFSYWFRGQYEYDAGSGYGYYEKSRAGINYRYVVNGRTYSRTVYGDWITPSSSEWYQNKVSVNLPSGVYYLQVRIVGYDQRIGGSFRTYVDLTSLDVTSGPYITSNTYGKMSYGYSIKSVVNDGSDDVDGVAPITASIALHLNPGYYVRYTKITISLEPIKFHRGVWYNPLDNDYHYTTQKSILYITSLSQGNNLGYGNDPGQLEARMNSGIRMVGTSFDIMLAAITSGWGAAALAGAYIVGVNSESILQFALDTDYDDRDADAYNDRRDYSAHEKWQYRTERGLASPNSDPGQYFVKDAAGIVNSKLMMDTSSASSFTVKMKFEAGIGESYYTCSIWGFRLTKAYTFSRTLTCTIYI